MSKDEVVLDVEEGFRSLAGLERIGGVWKTLYVSTSESMQHFLDVEGQSAAFKKHMRQRVQGQEIEFGISEIGAFIEHEEGHGFFWPETENASAQCIINGPISKFSAPGGIACWRRLRYEEETQCLHGIDTRILSDSKPSNEYMEAPDTPAVEWQISSLNEDVLQRSFRSRKSGASFTLIYFRSSHSNRHRNVVIHDAIEAKPATSRKFYKGLAFLPAILLYPCWLYVLIKNQIFKAVFLNFWPMTVAMVLGSFIAGSTPLGGGVVGFPVAVLALGFDAEQGRDFSALIQSIGMTSAAYLILLLKPNLVEPVLVAYSVVFGVLGCVIGFILPLDGFVVNLILTTYLSAFALVYCYKNEVIERYQTPFPPSQSERRNNNNNNRPQHHPPPVNASSTKPNTNQPKTKRRVVNHSASQGGTPPRSESKHTEMSDFATSSKIESMPTTPTIDHHNKNRRDYYLREGGLIFSALIGGFITAKLGSGSDSMVYIFGTFFYNRLVPVDERISESRMTASTVVIMATMSVVVVGLRLATGDISSDAFLCWGAAAPIVALGAPVGSIILGPASEIALRRFFYFIAAMQFILFAIIVIKAHVLAWTIISIVVGLTLLGMAYHYFVRFRPTILQREYSFVAQPTGQSFSSRESGNTADPEEDKE